MFDFLFKKQKKNRDADQSLKVDLHSHLLPGIDDGAQHADDTLTLIRGLQSLGYQKCITTPHIYLGVHNNSKEIIMDGLKKVRDLLDQQKINFQIEAAAEYFFDEQFFKLIDQNDLMTFGNKYVLFELPFTTKPLMVDDIIFKMNLAGYQPVLAHPERYSFFHNKKMQEYERMKNAGVLFQLNIMSLTGHYGEPVRHAARELISQGVVDFLGTDLHREKHLPIIEAAKKTQEYSRLLASGKLLNETL
ncbi:MAG TPA: CpsB/CapC family capsule biosynthesis tyrosine phosphatase [Chitinophagales bacterium]|nr:CpsB/CapC family capsule biosynthesis tyrosine phosphatase [Chitinophagales bacterium]